jgi:hypothetical protein
MSVRVYEPNTRDALRYCAAVDVLLVYPRQLREDEIVRHGPASQRVPVESIRTETHTRPLLHADGRTAVEIDAVIVALHGSSADVTDGTRVSVTVDATPTHETLPDGRDAWTAQEPRGGIEPERTRDDGGTEVRTR